MANGERTVKIRFTGESKGLKRAANDAEDAVKGFGSRVTKSIQAVTSKIPDVLTGAIGSLPPMGNLIAGVLVAGLAAALAPMLAAALSSALLLAIGGGALAIGIKSAIDNPRVSKAFDGLKKKATKVFDDFGKPFEGPLIRAAATFGKTLDKLNPAIQRISKMIAPMIDRLAPALGKFLEGVMPGIESAVQASLPLFDILADKLPIIGRELGNFFSKISENGDDAELFWSDMLNLITGTIVVLGNVIAKLASWYSNVRNFVTQAIMRFREFKVSVINELGGLLDGAVKSLGWIPGIGGKLKTAQKDFERFRINANAELAKIKDKEVRIRVWSNIGSVVANVANQLAGINASPRVSGRRASGGPVSAGRSYLVGERGPEVLTMGSSSGHVTPNRELAGGWGGDLYVEVDLGNAVKQVIKVNNRDLKRRAGAMA